MVPITGTAAVIPVTPVAIATFTIEPESADTLTGNSVDLLGNTQEYSGVQVPILQGTGKHTDIDV